MTTNTFARIFHMDDMILTGDTARIVYDDYFLLGTVEVVRLAADKSVRLVGIRPEGTDCVAWFRPSADGPSRLVSVGGSTVAFV